MATQPRTEDPRWAELLSLVTARVIANRPPDRYQIRVWKTVRHLYVRIAVVTDGKVTAKVTQRQDAKGMLDSAPTLVEVADRVTRYLAKFDPLSPVEVGGRQ